MPDTRTFVSRTTFGVFAKRDAGRASIGDRVTAGAVETRRTRSWSDPGRATPGVPSMAGPLGDTESTILARNAGYSV